MGDKTDQARCSSICDLLSQDMSNLTLREVGFFLECIFSLFALFFIQNICRNSILFGLLLFALWIIMDIINDSVVFIFVRDYAHVEASLVQMHV